MGRKFWLYAYFAGNSGHDHGGAVFVPHVVLDNQNRAVAFLFRANALAQIAVIQLAA